MRRRWALELLGCWLTAVAVTLPAVAAPVQTQSELVQRVVDGYVLPRVQTFAAVTKTLSAEVATFCRTPAEADRTALRTRFRDTLTVWAAVELVRFGPAAQEGRAQKIAFWPDPRGAVERQLRAALAQRDPALADPEALRAQSAALQGFPALEQIIADDAVPMGGAGEDGPYRCRAAVAIASNIANLAGELQQGWIGSGGWRERMLTPGAQNASYPSVKEAATEVVKSLLTGMQAIGEAQVKPLAEAEKTKKLKPSSFPYRRLGYSGDYLRAGIAAARDYYATAKLETYLYPPDDEKAEMAELVATAFSYSESEVGSPRWPTPASTEASLKFNSARAVLSMLGGARRVIATRIADAAGISIGFNELDGD